MDKWCGMIQPPDDADYWPCPHGLVWLTYGQKCRCVQTWTEGNTVTYLLQMPTYSAGEKHGEG